VFLTKLKRFEDGPIDYLEEEVFEFEYGMKSSMHNDRITLETRRTQEKLSISFALAQCVKLSFYEQRIQTEMERNKTIPESLARDGTIGISQKEVMRRIGRLFIERNSVNLYFDVLSTPEYFWENDTYKHIYDRLSSYLELTQRVNILNGRLDLMKELFEMLNDQLDALHASKLEWIIIILIVIEVVISVFWDIMVKDVFHVY